MFQPSKLDNYYTNLSDYSNQEINNLSQYRPKISGWAEALQDIEGLGGQFEDLNKGLMDLLVSNSPHAVKNSAQEIVRNTAQTNTDTAYLSGDHPIVDFLNEWFMVCRFRNSYGWYRCLK